MKVYVAWERPHANQMEEGSIPLEKVEVFEFNTQGEADAFVLGIEQGNGWDCPSWKMQSDVKVEGGQVILK